jgi:hypothetical protein
MNNYHFKFSCGCHNGIWLGPLNTPPSRSTRVCFNIYLASMFKAKHEQLLGYKRLQVEAIINFDHLGYVALTLRVFNYLQPHINPLSYFNNHKIITISTFIGCVMC